MRELRQNDQIPRIDHVFSTSQRAVCTIDFVRGAAFNRQQLQQQQQSAQQSAPTASNGEASNQNNAAGYRGNGARAPFLNYMNNGGSGTVADRSAQATAVASTTNSNQMLMMSTPNRGATGVGNGNGSGSGMSAWGLITLIVFVMLLGMAGYYVCMCYPIFCPAGDSNYYNTMREATSTTSSTTPLGNYDEKMGNYSSRSTTPSKSHE